MTDTHHDTVPDAPPSIPVGIEESGKARRDPNARYQMLGEIARGGMGVVYRGRDLDLGRDVAMKVLHEKLGDRPAMLERFIEEAQIGGQLQHPGIVPVYELGVRRGERPYFAMKLVKGETLAAQLARRHGPAEDRRRFLGIFEQVCQTMAYAHSRRVLHRDLKPANVMIGAFGEVQVVDWGFAKVLAEGTAADEGGEASHRKHSERSVIETVRSTTGAASHSVMGSLMGTPAYMPPEQATGDVDRMDPRSDVFGLGAILCEILTGAPPYVDEDGDLVQQAARGDTSAAMARIEACGASEALIALCKQCLSPAPRARPESAKEVADEVAAYLSSVEERARQAEVHAAEARVKARSTLLLSAAAFLLLALGGGGYQWVRSESERRQADAGRLVTSAMHDASTQLGAARAAGFDDLALWERVRAATEQVERLADSDYVAGDVKARARSFLATAKQDRARALAMAKRNARDRTMREALVQVRVPIDREHLLDTWSQQDRRRMDRAYAAAFRTYLDGRGLETLSADAAAAALARSPLRTQLAVAIDHWVMIRRWNRLGGNFTRGLQDLAGRLDAADSWRGGLRRLIPDAPQHRAKLVELAHTTDFGDLSPLSIILLADCLWIAGAQAESVQAYERGQRLHPGEFLLSFRLALIQEALDKPRLQQAVNNYRIAVALRPRMLAAWHCLGMALARQRRSEEAIACFRRAVAIDPEFAAGHISLGVELDGQGNAAESLASFRRAVAAAPNLAIVHSNLGHALVRQGKVAEAISSLRRALEIDPAYASAHVNLGNALQRAGRPDEAVASYRRGLAIRPRCARTHYNLGRVLRHQNKLDEAVASYRQAIEVDPQFAAAYDGLGSVLALQGKVDEGLRMLRRGIEVDPDDCFLRCRLGVMLANRGRLKEALTHLRHASEVGSKHRDANTKRRARQAARLASRIEADLAAWNRKKQ